MKQKLKDTSKGAGKRKTAKPLSQAEVEHAIIGWLRGNAPSKLLKKHAIGLDLRVMRRDDGTGSAILRVKDNTATYVTPQVAAGQLRERLHALPGNCAHYKMTHEQCIKVIKAFADGAPNMADMPKIVGFKSDTELCMTRLKFDPKECDEYEIEDKAPTFAKMMSRCGNYRALMARIGSIWDKNADRKQAVWVYGPPDGGKSQLVWLLQQLSPEYAIASADEGSGSKWKSRLLGKRVALVQEAAVKFIKSAAFKAMTGDDVHAIDPKYIQVFNANLPVLFFCFSNEAPAIPNDPALVRRVIACKLQPIPRAEQMQIGELRAKLTAELPYIAGACLAAYAAYGAKGTIENDQKDLYESMVEAQADIDSLLRNHLVRAHDEMLLASAFELILRQNGIIDNQRYHQVKDFLVRFWGCPFKQVTVRNNEKSSKNGQASKPRRVWAYVGVRLRNNDEVVIEADPESEGKSENHRVQSDVDLSEYSGLGKVH